MNAEIESEKIFFVLLANFLHLKIFWNYHNPKSNE